MTAHLSGNAWLLDAHGTSTAGHLLLGVGGTLGEACGRSPGVACRLAWDLTHDRAVADVIRSYFARPATVTLQILFVVVLALLARLAVHRMISKVTEHATEHGNRGDAAVRLRGERRHQRAQALSSVLRNVASVVIFGIAGMTIAGYLGLNLAPILASAGVIGLAIGFGAQSLVRDFISGIFMLLEDQYGVGDVINAGEASGTVEAVSLRTTRLRDVNGVVWHIRNGTIDRIGNQSQGWSRAVVDFPVPYRHDLAGVRSVMKETAMQMWKDPQWHEVIMEEPEVWGVETVYRDAVVMRLVARTLPMRQWQVARELRERLKAALDLPGDASAPAIGATDGPANAPAGPGPADAGVSPAAPEPPGAPTAAAAAKGGNGALRGANRAGGSGSTKGT